MHRFEELSEMAEKQSQTVNPRQIWLENQHAQIEEINYLTLLAHGFAVRFVEGGAFAWNPVLKITREEDRI